MSRTHARRPGVQRLSHTAAGAVSNAWNGGADRSDIADTAGHTAAELAARAMASGANAARHGVGGVAAGASRHMTHGKREMVAAYRTGLKRARKAEKAARRGGAASGGNAGGPMLVKDVKPSERITGYAAKGKASLGIGRHIGKGLGKVAGKAKALGSTGLGWVGEANARLTAGDDDIASKAGNTARDLAFKASRRGVRGVSSSARFIWRHRRAPVKAVRGAKSAVNASVRAARAMARVIRVIAAKIMSIMGAVSLPLIPLLVAILTVVVVLVSVLGVFMAGTASASTGVKGVPGEYESDVIRAGSICDLITPPVIAAQIEAESGWNPNAVSSVGATGIAQFMPSTWASSGKDGDGDGKADINNPHDQIWSEGNYMCGLAGQVESLKAAGRISGDGLQLTIAAYNAGLGNVTKYGGIPPFTETRNYVTRILALIAKYTDGNGTSGGTAGTLDKPLVMQSDNYHVDIAAMGIPATDTTYQVFQCTWWASVRRKQIGKPVDGYMGNGGDWNDSARRFGYPVSDSPQAGDVICFEPGVHGSDPSYGHVAVVETVNADGSILISQSGRGWMSVVTETITAQSLAAMGNGISFIH
ncbi:lytic transglycosylase domain-containing protein [Bifidobacterium moukalabense]|uniref:lytic transglycosylase domain-containing protein n=1 Tax=Bifidobacterium moukalabense TaxID=1333651 RepID=UPI0010F5E25F|nr:lytic transglycosylase domain-containing protein [Bifidobacterium moukalabense]